MNKFQGILVCVLFSCTVAVYAQSEQSVLLGLGRVGPKTLYALVSPDDKENELQWATALTECQKKNLTIAAIETPEEDEILSIFLVSRASIGLARGWLGGTDYFSEGNWHWLGVNHPVIYSNWNVEQPIPSETYNCMYAAPAGDNQRSKWSTQTCDTAYAFPICQSFL